MTIHPETKSLVLGTLKARGVEKAVLSYNGGNDEGGVESITFFMTGDEDGVDFPTQWNAKGNDAELAKLLERPVDQKYGSWAGDFSAYGTLTWDVVAGTVVMDDYEQSEYANTREEW